jgi:hypothetical protein
MHCPEGFCKASLLYRNLRDVSLDSPSFREDESITATETSSEISTPTPSTVQETSTYPTYTGVVDQANASITAAEGPLYFVCWSELQDLAVGDVGPFEVNWQQKQLFLLFTFRL